MARRDQPRRDRRRGGGRASAALLAVPIALAACGSSDHHADAMVVGPPPWWQPKLGEAKNWDIQLSEPIDVTPPRVMYDLDLWSLVPSPMMLDYGDGKPVAVPAGTHAGMIAQLHARTPRTLVICHIETGMWEAGRPDAAKFAGYNADPTKLPDNPDDPAPGAVKGSPAPGSVIGWSLGASSGGTAGKRFLDTHAAVRAAWAPIMWKRFELARQIGCDGIEAAHNDVSIYTSGFDPPPEDTYSWYAEVATQGHDRELSMAMKDGDLFTDKGAGEFDWLMIERCGEFDMCEVVRPFTDLNKAVLAIDYSVSQPDDTGTTHMQTSAQVCPNQVKARIQDGLFKDAALNKTAPTECNP